MKGDGITFCKAICLLACALIPSHGWEIYRDPGYADVYGEGPATTTMAGVAASDVGAEQADSDGPVAAAHEAARGSNKVLVVLSQGCQAEIAASASTELECAKFVKTSPLDEGIKKKWAKALACSQLPAFQAKQAKLKYKASYTAAIRRAVPYLQAAGWAKITAVAKYDPGFDEAVREADIVICSAPSFSALKKLMKPGAKAILTDSRDAATVSDAKDLKSSRVAAFLQHTSYMDLTENNGQLAGGRRHLGWLMESGLAVGKDVSLRSPPLSDSVLAKVHTLIPQVYRWRYPLDCGGGHGKFAPFAYGGFRQVSDRSFAPRLQDRPIDIAFAGAVHSSGRDKMGVGEHRAKAIKAIRKLQKKYNLTIAVSSGSLAFHDYLYLLRNSKAFVSPFGIGEFSGKDYEIILAGGLLVKPMASYLRSYPNIYSRETAVDSAIDFHNLQKQILPLLRSGPKGLERAQAMVDNGRRMLLEYSEPSRLAHDLDELLLSIA